MPALTVVLPTYQRRDLLLRAVRAIQNQSYPDFQICIYDNASTDGTQELCHNLAAADPRVIYYRHSTNIGSSKNFRFGMERVSSDYFMFASDDDVPLPGFFRAALDLLEKYPDARLAATETLEMTVDGGFVFAPLCLWPADGRFEASEGLRWLVGGRHPSWNSIIFRRCVIDEVGYFDPALGQLIDLEYTLRICSQYPFATTYEPGSIFIRHPGSAGEKTDPHSAEKFHQCIAKLTSQSKVSRDNARLLAQELAEMLRLRLLEGATKAILRKDVAGAKAFLQAHDNEFGARPASLILRAIAEVPGPLGRSVLTSAVAVRQRLRASRSAKALERTAGAHAASSARDYLRSLNQVG